MSQHEMAFTVLTSLSSDDKVVLSTHRVYTENGEKWVETYAGRVRQSDIDKATQPLQGSGYDRYGQQTGRDAPMTGDPELDDEIRKMLRERQLAKLADNPAATEKKATIELPVVDAVDFRVGRWYRIRFEEMDAGVALRNLIGNVQREEVAVERAETREQTRSQDRPQS